jgi:AcrR family transcriptional regulator
MEQRGPEGLGINAVAKEAGVDKVLIYRYFNGFDGLLRRYGESADFWPDLDEILGSGREVLSGDEGEAIGQILVNYARALRRRPATLELLAWECSHRNALTILLEETRERWSQELLAEIQRLGPRPTSQRLVISNLLSAAINYLAMRGRQIRLFGGMDIGSDEGWEAIEAAVAAAFKQWGPKRDPRSKRGG